MSNSPSPFDDIFAEEDTLGLLATKAPGPTRSSEDDIVIGQFEAINAFIDQYGFLPGSTADGREPGLQEYSLEGNLDAFLSSDHLKALLAPFDRHGLLGPASAVEKPPTTIDEIIASDDELLSSPADAIFDLKHVSGASLAKANPDEIARRRVCPDFERFEPIFKELREELASRKRTTKRFEREASIVPGAAFILNGIISYISNVDDVSKRRRNDRETRMRVIFDNGMEGNHLLRSFARMLYDDENGRQIIETAPSVSGPLFGGEGHVSGPLFTGEAEKAEDIGPIKGTVYVVESLSKDPNIVALKGRLYKIGFTTQDVQKRLADVEKDPTFLCSQVQLRATFEANFNPRLLEQLLHQFFDHAKLNVEVVLGKPINPKEWFVVPLDIVEQAVQMILDRRIINYRYDAISRKILPR